MTAQALTLTLPYTQLAAQYWSTSDEQAPYIIALHGWLDNSASFQNCLPYLSNYHCLAIDLAGHGHSDHRPAGSFYHLWDYVQDVVYLLRQQDKPVILVGHSLGGAVAMLVAAVLPESVAKLIVLDSAGPLVDQASARVAALAKAVKAMHLNARPPSKGYTSSDAMVRARCQGFTSLTAAAAAPLVARGSYQADHDKWLWRHDRALQYPSPYKMDEEGVLAFLAAISCPTLMLFAEQGLFQPTSAALASRLQAIAHADTRWLPGNHHFHLEPATAIAVRKEIQRFIRQNNYEKNTSSLC